MLNIFHNSIPNKNIICNYKDPSWFNNQIKTSTEKKMTKTRVIPPLLVNINVISNFREKANVFNYFFVQQCQPITKNSILLYTK